MAELIDKELVKNLSYSGYNVDKLILKLMSINELISQHKSGLSIKALCDIFSISVPHCYKILKENGIEFNHTLVNKIKEEK